MFYQPRRNYSLCTKTLFLYFTHCHSLVLLALVYQLMIHGKMVNSWFLTIKSESLQWYVNKLKVSPWNTGMSILNPTVKKKVINTYISSNEEAQLGSAKDPNSWMTMFSNFCPILKGIFFNKVNVFKNIM